MVDYKDIKAEDTVTLTNEYGGTVATYAFKVKRVDWIADVCSLVSPNGYHYSLINGIDDAHDGTKYRLIEYTAAPIEEPTNDWAVVRTNVNRIYIRIPAGLWVNLSLGTMSTWGKVVDSAKEIEVIRN